MSGFSDGRYRILVENAAEGICQMDAAGIIQFANRRVVEMFGAVGTAELVGRSVFDLLAESERARGRAMVERRARGLRDRYEIAFIRSDGSILSARLSAVPLFEEEIFAGSFSIITENRDRDSSETSRARRGGKRPRLGMGHLSLALWAIDADSVIHSSDIETDSPFWGRAGGEPGASLRNILREEERGRYDLALAGTMAQGSSQAVILNIATEGAPRCPALWSFSISSGKESMARIQVEVTELPGNQPFPTLPESSFYEAFGLSPRERDVIDLLLSGLEYKEIAWRLGIGLPTVRSHLMNSYRRLGIHSLDELCRLISRI